MQKCGAPAAWGVCRQQRRENSGLHKLWLHGLCGPQGSRLGVGTVWREYALGYVSGKHSLNRNTQRAIQAKIDKCPENAYPQIWGVEISPTEFRECAPQSTVKRVILDDSPPKLGGGRGVARSVTICKGHLGVSALSPPKKRLERGS